MHALHKILAVEGPCVLDVVVPHIQHVLSMISGGSNLQEIITAGDGLDVYGEKYFVRHAINCAYILGRGLVGVQPATGIVIRDRPHIHMPAGHLGSITRCSWSGFQWAYDVSCNCRDAQRQQP